MGVDFVVIVSVAIAVFVTVALPVRLQVEFVAISTALNDVIAIAAVAFVVSTRAGVREGGEVSTKE